MFVETYHSVLFQCYAMKMAESVTPCLVCFAMTRRYLLKMSANQIAQAGVMSGTPSNTKRGNWNSCRLAACCSFWPSTCCLAFCSLRNETSRNRLRSFRVFRCSWFSSDHQKVTKTQKDLRFFLLIFLLLCLPSVVRQTSYAFMLYIFNSQ